MIFVIRKQTQNSLIYCDKKLPKTKNKIYFTREQKQIIFFIKEQNKIQVFIRNHKSILAFIKLEMFDKLSF